MQRNRGAEGEGSDQKNKLGGGKPERRETEVQRKEEEIRKIIGWGRPERRETEEQKEKEVIKKWERGDEREEKQRSRGRRR